ncbi:contact-dependent growth inhibition system immunity protein [Confluentibacter lentus]|uniref:contact-dependent growth inhibition system immunity protein n=1 Tax=Confluentibacter lentus TaxID=1699412 RepID=UPI000C28F0C3|nr:contact-dependent growth inhibition system immunity protein [Confluentibacter lentus]
MIKLENNWQQKTLENLEKDFWGEPTYDSYLVKRTHEIRKLPLIELTNDDIAMMLRQEFSLGYIVPLAIEKLQIDILSFGESGNEGAIMEAILEISLDFWKVNKDYWHAIYTILDDNLTIWTFNRDKFDNALLNEK